MLNSYYYIHSKISTLMVKENNFLNDETMNKKKKDILKL
jgi:hypothetical protein